MRAPRWWCKLFHTVHWDLAWIDGARAGMWCTRCRAPCEFV